MEKVAFVALSFFSRISAKKLCGVSPMSPGYSAKTSHFIASAAVNCERIQIIRRANYMLGLFYTEGLKMGHAS